LKEHKKMYKAGKHWLTATLFAMAIGIFASGSAASADSTSNQPNPDPLTQQTPVATSTQRAVTIAAYSDYHTITINYCDQNDVQVGNQVLSGYEGENVATQVQAPQGYEFDPMDQNDWSNVEILPHDETYTRKVIPSYIDSSNVDYSVNTGHFDGYQLTTSDNPNFAHWMVQGWHVAGASKAQPYYYLIIHDNTTNQEIERRRITPLQRPDVRQAYPSTINSLYSGFNENLFIPYNSIGDSLTLIARYSNDPINGEGTYTDYAFAPVNFDLTHHAKIENTVISNNIVRFTGYDATNAAANLYHHFIIAYDVTTGQTIGQRQISVGDSTSLRRDLDSQFSWVVNAGFSGFDVSFDLSPALQNDQIQLVSRWTENEDGSGTHIDFRFAPQYLFGNHQQNYDYTGNYAYQDGYQLSKTAQGQASLHVGGWHAAGASSSQPYHWLILFDGSTNSEIARVKVGNVNRPDVARAYANVPNAGQSGFNGSFTINPQLLNHSLRLISRWSDDGDYGEGSRTDYWFQPMQFDHGNHAYLDNLAVKDNQIQVSGWHAANQAAQMNHHFIIVWDANQGRELTRTEIQPVVRQDVANALPTVANAGQSGFTASFDFLPEMSTDQIQFISRYSSDPTGNSNYCDYWFPAKQLLADQSNRGWLDQAKVTGNIIKLDNTAGETKYLNISGWHATNQSLGRLYHTIIILDATTHRELERKTITNVARPDVANAYPGILTAKDSGFSIRMDLKPAMAIHPVQIISRYSTSADANEDYIDYWFNPVSLVTDTANRASLDEFKVENNKIIAAGWHATNLSMGMNYHYLILLDKTAGNRELQRVWTNYSNYRPDVEKAFPQVLVNCVNSGFNVQFNYSPSLAGHQLQIVSRWTDDEGGNGAHPVDYWFDAKQLTNQPVVAGRNQSTVLIPNGYDQAVAAAFNNDALDETYLDIARTGAAMNGDIIDGFGLRNSNKSFIHNPQDQRIVINDPYHLDNQTRAALNEFAAGVINKIRLQMPLSSDSLVYASPASAEFGAVVTDGYNQNMGGDGTELGHIPAVAKAAAETSGINAWIGENRYSGNFVGTLSADGYNFTYTLDNLKQSVYNAILTWLFNDGPFNNPFGIGGHTAALLNYGGPNAGNHIANRQYISLAITKGNVITINFIPVNNNTASADTIARFANGATDGLA
jgi:SEC10/PgrA surface exclusion-like protein